MDKELLLRNLKDLVRAGQVTKAELLESWEEAARDDKQERLNKQSRLSTILYYIGGAVVFLGICIFVGTNWSGLNNPAKIMATLGSAVMMYFAGVLLTTYKGLEKIAETFYFIAGLVAPTGIMITMDIAGIDVHSAGSHSVIAAILLAVFLLSYSVAPRNVFMIFNVIFGTWLFFSFTAFLAGNRPFADMEFISYRWLAAGLSHAALGYALSGTGKKGLTPALYGFGVLEFLTAALVLSESSSQGILWELLFPGLVFGVLFLSVYLKARSFLVFGTIYLMVYILKITYAYFTSGFGWALSLIIAGFALIGIGYGAFYLNKKYIVKED